MWTSEDKESFWKNVGFSLNGRSLAAECAFEQRVVLVTYRSKWSVTYRASGHGDPTVKAMDARRRDETVVNGRAAMDKAPKYGLEQTAHLAQIEQVSHIGHYSTDYQYYKYK